VGCTTAGSAVAFSIVPRDGIGRGMGAGYGVLRFARTPFRFEFGKLSPYFERDRSAPRQNRKTP